MGSASYRWPLCRSVQAALWGLNERPSFCTHCDESGATAVEHGLIATFIGIVLIASISALGTKLRAPFKDVANNLAS
ncbi:MAG: Flp family type IVb pilin [Methylocystis sp.]